MAEIRNYTMNFGSGRPVGLNLASQVSLHRNSSWDMVEILNDTMSFGSGRPVGLNLASQVSLHRNESLKRLVVGLDHELLRPEAHG